MASRLMVPFIILQIATVIAIILFLRMLLHKQLNIGLKRLQRLDQENVKKEAQLNDRLQSLDKEYKIKLAEAQRRAELIIDAAKEEAKKMREDERLKAKEETKKVIASAHQEKERVLKEAKEEVFNKGVDFSTLILKRVFSEDELRDFRLRVSKNVVKFLIDSKEVDELLKKNVNVEVITADPVTTDDKKYILKTMDDKTNKKAKVKFTVDKKILGGLILKIGERIIDGSIAYRVNKAALEAREELK